MRQHISFESDRTDSIDKYNRKNIKQIIKFWGIFFYILYIFAMKQTQ